LLEENNLYVVVPHLFLAIMPQPHSRKKGYDTRNAFISLHFITSSFHIPLPKRNPASTTHLSFLPGVPQRRKQDHVNKQIGGWKGSAGEEGNAGYDETLTAKTRRGYR
jgi:hypothetical protein